MSTKNQILWAASIALFWVIFNWGFWEKGIYSLGFNATVFVFLILASFILSVREKNNSEVFGFFLGLDVCCFNGFASGADYF